jgi:hypothetical protein
MESIREKVMPSNNSSKNNIVMTRKLGINNNQVIRMGINNKPIKKRMGM